MNITGTHTVVITGKVLELPVLEPFIKQQTGLTLSDLTPDSLVSLTAVILHDKHPFGLLIQLGEEKLMVPWNTVVAIMPPKDNPPPSLA